MLPIVLAAAMAAQLPPMPSKGVPQVVVPQVVVPQATPQAPQIYSVPPVQHHIDVPLSVRVRVIPQIEARIEAPQVYSAPQTYAAPQVYSLPQASYGGGGCYGGSYSAGSYGVQQSYGFQTQSARSYTRAPYEFGGSVMSSICGPGGCGPALTGLGGRTKGHSHIKIRNSFNDRHLGLFGR